jgi:hypothetical protein
VEPQGAHADQDGLVGVIGAWFHTEYDEPRAVLDLPVEVDSGRDDAVCIVDQVIRGTGIVGRVTGDFGAVALKIRGTGRPVHVIVDVQLDDLSTRWWSDRVRPPRHHPELPRLVLVRAQGDIRGAALLARRQGWRGAGSALARVEFDMAADDLDRDGLLVVELAETPRPSWSDDRISARSALGLRIDTIFVREAGAPTATRFEPTGCDLAVLQPGGPAEFRLDVASVPLAPPVPRSPSTKFTRRRPPRAAFKLGRIARRVAVRAGSQALPERPGAGLGVLAADLRTGEPLPVEVVARRPGSLNVRLASPPQGPVLIGLDAAHPGLSCRIVPTR